MLEVLRAPDKTGSATGDPGVIGSDYNSWRAEFPVKRGIAYDVYAVVCHFNIVFVLVNSISGPVVAVTNILDPPTGNTMVGMYQLPGVWARFTWEAVDISGTSGGTAIGGSKELVLPRPYRVAGPQLVVGHNLQQNVGIAVMEFYYEEVAVPESEWLALMHRRSRSSA